MGPRTPENTEPEGLAVPTYQGDEGSLIVDPQGDILFAVGLPSECDDRHEIVIAHPGPVYGTGVITYEFAGATSDTIKAKVRIKLTRKTAVILLETLSNAMIQMEGLPVRELAMSPGPKEDRLDEVGGSALDDKPSGVTAKHAALLTWKGYKGRASAVDEPHGQVDQPAEPRQGQQDEPPERG